MNNSWSKRAREWICECSVTVKLIFPINFFNFLTLSSSEYTLIVRKLFFTFLIAKIWSWEKELLHVYFITQITKLLNLIALMDITLFCGYWRHSMIYVVFVVRCREFELFVACNCQTSCLTLESLLIGKETHSMNCRSSNPSLNVLFQCRLVICDFYSLTSSFLRWNGEGWRR